MGNVIGNVPYRELLLRVQRYVVSQGIPVDSPRARKYAASQGVNPDDLQVELTHIDMAQAGNVVATAGNYARSLGLDATDPSVRRYITAGAEPEPLDDVDIDSEVENEKFKESVLHYAQAMNMSVDDPRVRKYARGLLKPTGDFSTEKFAEKVDKTVIERRIAASVERYADSMQLSLDDPQVKKYEQGQRNGPYRALLGMAN